MLKKRIIPCLDLREGTVVKGVQFGNLVQMGDPTEHARFYNDEGADELVILDVTASAENRGSMISVIESVADAVFIPLTVGGGVRDADDVRTLLNAGADRVSINTAAVKNSDVINRSAARFGSQCIVAAVDVKRITGGRGWQVFIYGGKEATGLDGIQWMKEVERRGAGEILLTSMDRDGTQEGFDIELLHEATSAVSIPVIASGGAGRMEHFADAFISGGADAVLAASLFHTRQLSVRDVKTHASQKGVPIR